MTPQTYPHPNHPTDRHASGYARSGGHPSPVGVIPSAGSASEDFRRPTHPAGAVSQSSETAPAGAPYHCTVCGADSPYVGRKPRRRGGNACRQCSQVERAIHDAQAAAYAGAVADAYRNGCHGDEKRAIIANATRIASEAWRAAQIGFGIGVGAAQAAVDVEPAARAPRPTTAVQVRYAGPVNFGVSAIGGGFDEVAGAIVAELRAMAEAGMIGPGELTDVGVELMDAAQDMALAGSAVAA